MNISGNQFRYFCGSHVWHNVTLTALNRGITMTLIAVESTSDSFLLTATLSVLS